MFFLVLDFLFARALTLALFFFKLISILVVPCKGPGHGTIFLHDKSFS